MEEELVRKFVVKFASANSNDVPLASPDAQTRPESGCPTPTTQMGLELLFQRHLPTLKLLLRRRGVGDTDRRNYFLFGEIAFGNQFGTQTDFSDCEGTQTGKGNQSDVLV